MAGAMASAMSGNLFLVTKFLTVRFISSLSLLKRVEQSQRVICIISVALNNTISKSFPYQLFSQKNAIKLLNNIAYSIL